MTFLITLVPYRFARELGLVLIWLWLMVLGIAALTQAPDALERHLFLAVVFALASLECWALYRQPEPPLTLAIDDGVWSALPAPGARQVLACMYPQSRLFGRFAVLDMDIEGQKYRCYLLKRQNSRLWRDLQYQWGLQRFAESGRNL